MRINQVTDQVNLSKRAIKYYEEEGLLIVSKDENGYRNYTEKDVDTLKEISVYRKLGVGIKDIKILLDKKDKELLTSIYNEKKNQLEVYEDEVNALKRFIENDNIQEIYEVVDYENIAKAMEDMFPGFYGYFFMNHFIPYLQMQIETKEQQEAYRRIIEFWDNVNIKIPFVMKINSFILYKLSKPKVLQMCKQMESQIQMYANISEEHYESLREQTRRNVKVKNSFIYKYHPAFISQRRFMKQLQDCGYNDIFISNMIELSPKYKEYHTALTKINERICSDLGLYYDSKYNLIMKY